VQFARKLGADVVVFSTTPAKEAEARALGAGEFCLLGELGALTAPVDVLVLTGNSYPDFGA
jgi:D-arabinose 1-dehydrogenase-like Zn-dependent alcohol dehydrogenase